MISASTRQPRQPTLPLFPLSHSLSDFPFSFLSLSLSLGLILLLVGCAGGVSQGAVSFGYRRRIRVLP